jgi:hypothetical protein
MNFFLEGNALLNLRGCATSDVQAEHEQLLCRAAAQAHSTALDKHASSSIHQWRQQQHLFRELWPKVLLVVSTGWCRPLRSPRREPIRDRAGDQEGILYGRQTHTSGC